MKVLKEDPDVVAGDAVFCKNCKIGTAMVDGRIVDGPQDAVRDVGRTGNLEEVSAWFECHGCVCRGP